jgi:serine protease AprX
MEIGQVAGTQATKLNKVWGRTLRLTLLAVIVMPAFAAAPKVDVAPRAQQEALDMAAQRPDAKVAVIVQKAVRNNGPEQMVGRLGGKVTQQLSLINAFAAEMPARSIATLAKDGNVRWVSLDSPVEKSSFGVGSSSNPNLQNAYIRAIRADSVWNEEYRGEGVGIAVLDSGVDNSADFGTADSRMTASVRFNSAGNQTTADMYGHGTHVAGIIAGDSTPTNDGLYVGVAPRANIISVKVSDNSGVSTSSNLVAGMQWIYENKDTYNIRVVNISLNSSTASNYNSDPIDAAAEILWFNGIVVVASAGNTGSTGLTAPANDPFVITVGAADDHGTNGMTDDTMASFSAYGTTSNGVSKPDLVAPGVNIVSRRSNSSALAASHPSNRVGDFYFRMSGTSMAAPMVAGAAALLLQSNPDLNPDQVKYRLKATAHTFGTSQTAGTGYLDVQAALHSTTTATANTGMPASQLLWTGTDTRVWGSVNWSSMPWMSVNWSSVNWSSVPWTAVGGGPLVNWSSDYWGP